MTTLIERVTRIDFVSEKFPEPHTSRQQNIKDPIHQTEDWLSPGTSTYSLFEAQGCAENNRPRHNPRMAQSAETNGRHLSGQSR